MDSKRFVLVLLHLVLQLSNLNVIAHEKDVCGFVPSLNVRETLITGKPSKNKGAFVVASAYLSYYDDIEKLPKVNESRLMEVRFEDFDYQPIEPTEYILTMEADCAIISMRIKVFGLLYIVSGINVDLIVPNKGVSSCKIEDVGVITQLYGRNYNCDTDCGSKVCKSESGSEIVDLVFTKLEFDLTDWPYQTFTFSHGEL